MIIKSYELEKINIKEKNILLLYGENEGLKSEIIKDKFKKKFEPSIYNYDEVEILKNEKNFFEEILSQSFFEKYKLIIINRSTDKITKIVKEITGRSLRNLFEKDKNLICCAFYPDDHKSLFLLANNFFRKEKISISQDIINIIIQRCGGNRQNLRNELQKVVNYLLNKKNITLEEIIKLTNSIENKDIVELVDTCLAKNEKKMIQILNENNFSKDETILIIRTFLLKAKRLLRISEESNGKNIDNVLTSFRPPIFWKDKTIVKQQIQNYSSQKLKKLIISINKNELLIKKNFENSLNILFDFIFQETRSSNN